MIHGKLNFNFNHVNDKTFINTFLKVRNIQSNWHAVVTDKNKCNDSILSCL